ncbi:MAG TPA: SiaC family regulatory phosphoprotein [Bacteroidales bacterium]|nr:SiaC family regulatory phosphoprotein [Bacteroidales bacterium]
MNNYQIEGSTNSPAVVIDGNKGIVDISGSSDFKSAKYFYQNLSRWINAFNLGSNKTRVINIRLSVINRSSARWLKRTLKQIDKRYHDSGRPVINWYYSRNNEFIMTVGERYRMILNLPFNIIAA